MIEVVSALFLVSDSPGFFFLFILKDRSHCFFRFYFELSVSVMS